MDILAYIQSLLSKRNYHAKPIKLMARDNTTIVTPNIKEQTYTTNDEGLINAFPKQMNWLNWKNKGFRNALLDSQIWTESRGNPNAVGPMTRYGVSAVGAGQFMPKTWETMIERKFIPKGSKRTDLNASLMAQGKYMDLLYNRPEMIASETEGERINKALAAYNYGYGNLRKALKRAKSENKDWMELMPYETRNYVSQIRGKAEEDYFKNKEDYVSPYERQSS